MGLMSPLYTKEDRAEVTLGILIKIPPNLLLDLSPITSYPMLLGTGLGEDLEVFFIKILKLISAQSSLPYTVGS